MRMDKSKANEDIRRRLSENERKGNKPFWKEKVRENKEGRREVCVKIEGYDSTSKETVCDKG